MLEKGEEVGFEFGSVVDEVSGSDVGLRGWGGCQEFGVEVGDGEEVGRFWIEFGEISCSGE